MNASEELAVSGTARLGPKRLRFIRAYWTTLVVLTSYVRLGIMRKLFGAEYPNEELSRIHSKNARRIERTISELQGLFIKVGQLISIMTNFLPEEFRKPLETLQDRVPPRPFSEIRERIESELGRPIAELFSALEETPLASASLGQVHRARLTDGAEVVVKVQHKDIDDIARIDLRTIWKIMLIVRYVFPMQGLHVIYNQIREMILSELDFIREAAFMERIGKNLEGFERVIVPKIHQPYCTSRILTLDYVEGTKISDLSQLDAWGLDRTELARRLVRAYCKMIFVDGIYHADPHPGNVLVQQDGTLALLDFGAVAELSPSMRQGIPDFLEAVIKRDTQGIFRTLRSMGFISHGVEAERASERIVEYFHRRFQDEVRLESLNLKDIRLDPQKGFENFLDLRKQQIGIRELTSAFQVPKDWVLLERTLLLIGGVCTHLDPEMNPMAVIRPYLEEFVLGEGNDFSTLVMNTVKESALTALSVPGEIKRYIHKATRGELETPVPGLTEGMQLIYALGHQLIYALFTLTFAVLSIQFYLQRLETFFWMCAAIAGGAFVFLLGSVYAARRWQRRTPR